MHKWRPDHPLQAEEGIVMPIAPVVLVLLAGLNQDEINALKDVARAHGTYYQGSVSFSSLPNGIVFVDTASGDPIGNPPDPADLASVTITGGTGSGWLIVMGSITITGDVSYSGVVYAANDILYRRTGIRPVTVRG